MRMMDPAFEPLLAGHDADRLEAHAGVIYGVWADWRLAYANPAWLEFAAANGGSRMAERSPLGRSLFDAIPTVLREYYRAQYQHCLDTGAVWSHTYQCPGAYQYRDFHQLAYPLHEGRGLLIVNSLNNAYPNPATPAGSPADGPAGGTPELPADRYLDTQGFIHQCAHCRRTRRQDDPDHWDWVPRWVEQLPENTSHVLCEPCRAHYFPEPER